MKYDCTKTEDYIHELNRMCLSFHDMGLCSLLCPLKSEDHRRKTDFGTIKETVEIVQNWSNRNSSDVSAESAATYLQILIDSIWLNDYQSINLNNLIEHNPQIWEALKYAKELIDNRVNGG